MSTIIKKRIENIFQQNSMSDSIIYFLIYYIFLLMGSSKSKPGIFININKQYYFPGDAIEGNVYINAPKPYPCSRILLSVTGYENCEWKAQTNNNQKAKVEVEQKAQSSLIQNVKFENKSKKDANWQLGSVKILQTSHILNSWDEQHSLQGQYAFPFTFHLPSYIPASFKQQTPRYRGVIMYEITCICLSPKKQYEDLKYSQQVMIRVPQKKQNKQIFGQFYLRPKSCCCCSQGVCKITCFFQKNQYLPNQNCVAFCEVDNYKSKTQIKNIRTTFKKFIVLKSNTGQQKIFNEVLNEGSFPGVRAHDQYIGENVKRMQIPLKYKKSAHYVHPSTNGSIVQCYYQLELNPVLAGCCTKGGIYFTLPIQIIQEGLKLVQPERPDNWNPQLYRKIEGSFIEPEISNKKLDVMSNYKY